MIHLNNGAILSCKENKIIKFAGKCMELENTIKNLLTQTKNEKKMNVLSVLWFLIPNL